MSQALLPPGGALSWSLVTALGVGHAFLTLVISALREKSNARLEARLGDPQQIERYHNLLQDEHLLATDLSTLRSLSQLAFGSVLAWIALGRVADQPPAHPLDIVWLFGVSALSALFIHVWPRAFGENFSEIVVMTLMPLTRQLLWICTPLTGPYRWLTTIALRVAGSPADGDNEEFDDEIRSAALEAMRDGALERSDLDMIERVIDFRDIEVTEIMTPRVDVVGISLSASFSETVELFLKHGHSRLPVYEDNIDKIVGLVHIKDVLEALSKKDQGPLPALQEILRKPLFVPESKLVRDLFIDIKRTKTHAAVVVDEYGGTAGFVTISDIVSEIFGAVDDEHDTPVERAAIENIEENRFSIDGKLHIDELNESLHLELPETDDYDTVAGFLLANLGRIPTIGEEHRHQNLTFKVIEADERKVDRIELTVAQATPA